MMKINTYKKTILRREIKNVSNPVHEMLRVNKAFALYHVIQPKSKYHYTQRVYIVCGNTSYRCGRHAGPLLRCGPD